MNASSLTSSENLSGRQAQLIIENAIDYAIVGLDLDGAITSWNVGAERIMGWSASDAIGRSVDLFFTLEDIENRISEAEMSAAVRHGRGVDERWHLRQDGSRFWANGEMMPLRSGSGDLEGYVKILRDRTEQHYTAVALSESEDRYRALSDSIDEGFCLIEVRCDDAAKPIDYRFLEVNPAFERQTGLIDAPGNWMRDLAPNHEQHWFDMYARIALTGQSKRFTLPAEALNGRWYEVFAYRVGDPADRLVAILFSDITERRVTESRLKASEEHQRGLNASLRSSEANLRLLLNSISEGFYAVDNDGLTTTCNAAFLQMMGFDNAQDVIGRRLHDVIHHSHVDGSPYPEGECPIYVAARDGRPAHVLEELFFPINREPLWVEYRATPIIQDGKLRGAICTFENITERRQRAFQQAAVEARRAALLLLGDTLRNMDDPAAMAAAAAEVVGQTLGVSAAGFGRIDASDQTLVIERDWKITPKYVIAGEHPMRNYGSYIDDLLENRTVAISDVRTDARTSPFAMAFENAGVSALLNAPVVERNRLTAIFCVVSHFARDWTTDEIDFVQQAAERTRVAIERRRVELELQTLAGSLQEQVEERTQERDRVWQVSRDLLGVADAQGIWISVNPAWSYTLGWPPEAFVGKTSEWLEHPDDRARTREEVGRLAEGHTTLFFENRFRTKDGGFRNLAWSAVPTGGLLYCVARDITEQKERDAALVAAEEQLRQSQKVEAVGQLTGGVAHDFNNLLTVIRGSVDLLRRPNLSDERRERYIAAISDTADRATKLTSQLLAFARRQALKAEVFDVSASVAGISDMLVTLTGSRVVIEMDVPPGQFLIKADRSQFDTALVNMAVNARDAMKGEGTLAIGVHEVNGIPAARSHPAVPGRFVALSLRDTGSGIAPEQLDRIFEPFYTTKGVGHGTGLGLSQVFGFAKQSSGEVIVSSVVGEGATFTLYLPKAASEERELIRPAGEGGTPLAAGACILVVEDNSEVGSFATQALSELGYTTKLAIDAASALVELSKGEFDLVFSDVVMPGMSGIELRDEILRRFPDIPVVLTSGYSSVLAEQDETGFELLQKPYSLDELAKALAKAAATHSHN
ncbi:PAS domain S-box protein [Sphingomonas sp. 8AM]|uniref:PAS domain S-box protein n=1 Tax=Sphingomonas sp. 8AM TaxID=2653170 RepID=UPI0012F065BA|nr:PAS domain S-box protein [Sphingomonas sp. 8AM]VXC35877.1 Histidine kinase (modular protein) [Sphingomonas sp. 8AM]